MTLFYFIAIIPILIGGVIWLLKDEMSWMEWVGGSVVALLMAVCFHALAIHGMTSDIETWSGQITSARHTPAWQEYYEYAVYRTEYYTETVSDGNGKSHTESRSREVFDHWEPTTRWHSEYWRCFSDINTQYGIDSGKFNYFVNKYDNINPVRGSRSTFEHASKMIAGDPNDYVTDYHKTGWVEPVTKTMSWQNRIKAAPTVFSFIKVPTNINVFEWPQNDDAFHSDRVMGIAKASINEYEWDKLNAQLGAFKKVNLIIVGFKSEDSMLGQYQQAKWIGGKKNDLVITFGGQDPRRPSWIHCFGWTESELVKRNVESYLMKQGISEDFIPFLKNQVILNYKIKDWTKFDYIRIEPRPSYYFWYIIAVLISQVALNVFFMTNDVRKSYEEKSFVKSSK